MWSLASIGGSGDRGSSSRGLRLAPVETLSVAPSQVTDSFDSCDIFL
jgi:hypothetical protein